MEIMLSWWFAEKWFILLVLLLNGKGICFTHWMVSDDGLTIQLVTNSPYQIKQPHSLVQFLDQERKLETVAQIRSSINENEKNINEYQNADDPELEKKIRTTDKDCITGGSITSSKRAFMMPYALGKLSKDMVIIADIDSDEDDEALMKEPHCITDLPFSMYTFEHLTSVQQRDELKIDPETGFMKLIPENYSVEKLGSNVAKALEQEPTNASFLRLAALYWRIKGDAQKAIECFRRASHFATREQVARIWFEFGNLIHRAGHPSDAIILYQLALRGMNHALIHVALADSYALIQNRTEAIEHYGIALSMEPSLKSAHIKIAALKCDLKLISAMEEQHKNLLDTIKEKNDYNDKIETMKKMEESIKENAADINIKTQSALIYDYFTYGSLPHSFCRSVTISGRLAMQCSVSDWRRYRVARDEKYYKLVTNAKRIAEKDASESSVQNAVEDIKDSDELKAFRKKLEPMKGISMDEPTGKPIYPRKLSPSMNKLLEHYMGSSWPNKTLCEKDQWRFPIPTMDNLPELFMSPENKGFRPSDLVGKYLGLNDGEIHPLPWHSPVCGIHISDQPLSATFRLPGVQAAAARLHSLQFAEDKLRVVFLKLLDGKITEADIAQRIATLMKYKIGPKWLVYNLAALYWRIVGAPGEAINCLRAALQTQPERYADVALVQLAQIVIRSSNGKENHLNDAVTLLNSAMRIDPNEPITHFLMGIIRILQKKHATALAHIRASVILDPLFQPAVAVLHALKCLSKNEQGLVRQRLYARCCSPAEPNVYCFGTHTDRCFTIFKDAYIGTACSLNPDEKQDSCRRAFSFAPFIAPVNFTENKEAIKKVQEQLIRHTKIAQRKLNIDVSDEIPLDYGAEESLQRIRKMTTPSTNDFYQSEILYASKMMAKETKVIESWEEDVVIDKIIIPEFRLTLNYFPERRKMIMFDIPLPELLPKPSKKLEKDGIQHMTLPGKHACNNNFCANTKMSIAMLRELSTPTWLSVTAKGVNLEEFIDFQSPVDLSENFEPVCVEPVSPSPILSLDHLPAYHLRYQFIYYKPEKALKDAFLKLGKEKERIEAVAKRLKDAMALSAAQSKNNDVHWSLSTASALYWRVKGDAVNALKCLRLSLNTAPPEMRDVALVSMANIYHQAGLLHSALIAGGAALSISPKLVAAHFTLANIYTSLDMYRYALMFYYSTLSMQPNFEPAKERIRTIYCFAEEIRKTRQAAK